MRIQTQRPMPSAVRAACVVLALGLGLVVGCDDQSAGDPADLGGRDGPSGDTHQSDGTAADSRVDDFRASDGAVDGETDAPAVSLCGPPQGWSSCALPPAPMQETAVLAYNGWMVVIGGISGEITTVTEVNAYDPATDTWFALASVPAEMHHAQAVVHGGVLYVLGFLNPNFSANGSGWRYDVENDDWQPVAAMSRPRGGGAAASVGGVLVVVGGLSSGGAVDWVDAYDPSTDAWRSLAPLPFARDHFASGVIDGLLYVAGGRQSSLSSNTPRADVYDPALDIWSPIAPVPTARGGVAAAVVDGRLHVLGGEGNDGVASGVFEEHEVYDPMLDTWLTLEPMPVPVHGTGAATLNGAIHVPGGATIELFGAAGVEEHQVYRP